MSPRLAGRALAIRAWATANGRLLVLATVVSVLVAFYFWTALSSLATDDVARDGVGFYGLLGDSFTHGRLSLDLAPDPRLLALVDPYDPAANAPFRLHDASLFDGRYYLYFGPTPALLLFAPAKLFGIVVTEPFACALFASIALIAAAWLINILLRRFAATVGTPATAFMVLVVGLANGVPFALRRPAVYETAITAGLACTTVVALLVALAIKHPRLRMALLISSGVVAGLAVGARPHLALIMILPLFGVLQAWRTEGRRTGLRLLASSTVPFVGILALLALYNALRFGDPLEFGSGYQLAGVDPRANSSFDAARLIPGAFFYFLAPPSFSSAFPFVSLEPEWPGGGLPAAYTSIEPVGGALLLAPVIVLGLCAVAILSRRGAQQRHKTGIGYPLALAATAILIAVATMVRIPAATQRYEVDWLTLLLMASVVAIGIAMAHAGTAARRSISAAMIALGTYSCMVGTALGMTGYFDTLRLAHPNTYKALEDTFAFVPTLSSRASKRPLVQRNDVVAPGIARLQFVVGATGPVVITMSPDAVSGSVPAAYRIEVADPATGETAVVRAQSGQPASVLFRAHHGINRTTVRFLPLHADQGAALTNLALGDAAISYPSNEVNKGSAP